jgi:mannose/fructose/N-acetylgalactosamine-specific phosphotransferase system component IID
MKNLKYLLILFLLTFSLLMPAQVLAATSSKCRNPSDAGIQNCLQNNQIVKDLNTIVTILSGIVGIVVIGSLIFAGIRYSLAGDNSQEVSAAKQRIINSFIALVVYIAIFSILQWLIPGGLFS